MDWELSDSMVLHANYAYQDSKDSISDEDSGNTPKHQIYTSVDWQFAAQWTIRPAVNFVLDRQRPPGDQRNELDDYALVDLTLINKAPSDRWLFKLGVRNLFDSKPKEPTDASFNVSNDLPLAGRSVFAELTFSGK